MIKREQQTPLENSNELTALMFTPCALMDCINTSAKLFPFGLLIERRLVVRQGNEARTQHTTNPNSCGTIPTQLAETKSRTTPGGTPARVLEITKSFPAALGRLTDMLTAFHSDAPQRVRTSAAVFFFVCNRAITIPNSVFAGSAPKSCKPGCLHPLPLQTIQSSAVLSTTARQAAGFPLSGRLFFYIIGVVLISPNFLLRLGQAIKTALSIADIGPPQPNAVTIIFVSGAAWKADTQNNCLRVRQSKNEASVPLTSRGNRRRLSRVTSPESVTAGLAPGHHSLLFMSSAVLIETQGTLSADSAGIAIGEQPPAAGNQSGHCSPLNQERTKHTAITDNRLITFICVVGGSLLEVGGINQDVPRQS